MGIMKKLFVLLSMTGAISCNGVRNDTDYEAEVDSLYSKMTLEEKIQQLKGAYLDDLEDLSNAPGHFSQFASQKPMGANELRDRVEKVQNWLIRNTPNGIPALFHEEVLSGVNTRDATIYPQQIGLACSFNPELAEIKTLQTGVALRKMGGVLSLSPMVDVCRNPGFNRLEESYGEDGYLSAVMGTAFVRGLQQGDLKKGVAACSKHYLGYGGGGDADEKELMEEILLPHETIVRLAGGKAVMPGYHDVHGVKCSANSEVLADILRGYVGFDGMVVSDYDAIGQNPLLDNETDKAAAALNAGTDVDFPSGRSYDHLPEALEKGLVSPEAFERAVKNVLRFKFRSGLMDHDPYLCSKEDIKLDSPEERQTAYELATQSVVLLENNGILPLRDVKNVLLTGPNANSPWAMCGDYSYPSMSYFWKFTDAIRECPHIVTLREGLSGNPGIKLMYSRGCDWTEEIETTNREWGDVGDERAWQYGVLHRKVDSGEVADPEEALALAAGADVIIAAVGENVMLCGEARDRQGLHLPGRQEEYVRRLVDTGKPVILVVFGGRAQVISEIAGRCAAVIQAWYPGEEGGNAVADILCGKVSPSAKLSVSYPSEEIYEPVCYNRQDKPDPRIAWPFGYGLTYTTFEYSNMKVSGKVKTTDESFTLSFEVRNTGEAEATEIAQLYLSPTSDSRNIRPIQLQGFKRVPLKPGEKRRVRIKVYTEQLGFYSNVDGHRQWNIVPGDFILKVGSSSADIRLQQTITLAGKPVVKPLRDHYFSESTLASR